MEIAILRVSKTHSSKSKDKHRFNFNSSITVLYTVPYILEGLTRPKKKERNMWVLHVQCFTQNYYTLLSGNELHFGLTFLYFFAEFKCQLKAFQKFKVTDLTTLGKENMSESLSQCLNST